MFDKNQIQINITKDEFENFKNYTLGKNKTLFKTTIISLVVALVLVFCYDIFRYPILVQLLGSDLTRWVDGWAGFPVIKGFFLRFFLIYFDLVLSILLTALCGHSIGAIFVWIIFNLASVMTSTGFAYSHLVFSATLITNIPARRGWFKTFPKMLLSTLILTFAIGWGLFIVETVIATGSFDFDMLFERMAGRAFPVALCSSLLLYLYHRFMPQKIKDLFPESEFSSPQIRAFQKKIINQRKYLTSKKIRIMCRSPTSTRLA